MKKKRVRPKIVCNGLDKAEKSAQDALKKTSKNHAHNTLI
jgi:chaperonin GroEL (HSP60 family)